MAEISTTSAGRITKVTEITSAQIDAAIELKKRHFPGEVSIDVTMAILNAMATNYLAYVTNLKK